jgi:hypothetical protein
MPSAISGDLEMHRINLPLRIWNPSRLLAIGQVALLPLKRSAYCQASAVLLANPLTSLGHFQEDPMELTSNVPSFSLAGLTSQSQACNTTPAEELETTHPAPSPVDCNFHCFQPYHIDPFRDIADPRPSVTDGSLADTNAALHSCYPQGTITGVQGSGCGMNSQPPALDERLRFSARLNAPTAIKRANEIPVTYLDKDQAYSLSVIDTATNVPIAPGTRFRTFVRISFDDPLQRQKPEVCWSIWKARRGIKGDSSQAIEYIEAPQPAVGDDERILELESSFDGFSVIWKPGVVVKCNIALRFNFLSTDLSRSKALAIDHLIHSISHIFSSHASPCITPCT